VSPHEERLRDAYLAEMWPTVREIPRDVRAGWAALGKDREERLSETRGEPQLPFREVA
jgi:hypothetical protein